jgi:hypothetical protein
VSISSQRLFFLPLIPLLFLPLSVSLSKKRVNADNRINNGDGRQIVPGQKCHRSVLRRLMYEADKTHKVDKATAYKGPAADGAKGWPTWEEVKRGKAMESEIWLD